MQASLGASNNNNACPSNVILKGMLINVGINLSTLTPNVLGMVHWIERGTNGYLVLAKTNDTHAQFVTNFFASDANTPPSQKISTHNECERNTHHLEISYYVNFLGHLGRNGSWAKTKVY